MTKPRLKVVVECPCGQTFKTSDSRKKRCRKDCGREERSNESRHGARNKRRAEHIINFVGVDGEGVTREDGTHDYVLLSVGDKSLSNPDGSRLHWTKILAFLWDHHCDNPGSAYIGFFLGYDFTQWLRTIPEKKAHALLTKQGIEQRSRPKEAKNPTPYSVWLFEPKPSTTVWEIDILGDKRFKVRYQDRENPNDWMYICDTGAFWQCSFLSAIDPDKWPIPITTADEYATIKEGKARRDVAVLDEDMIRYNITENRVLARVMGHLNTGFTKAGIRLDRKQWFGPGQAAQAWLDLIGAPTGELIREAPGGPPEAFREAAQFSYYGGWFEIMGHGHIPGTTYEYDINSAYPAVIATLPCLLHGKWSEGTTNRMKELPPGHLRLVHADIQGENNITGAMPFRLHDGKICRPKRFSGWYWWHELVAAREAGLIRPGQRGEVAGIRVNQWMEYAPCDCPPPIAAIADLYERRISPGVGKDSPEGIALKLVYNSSYGKFAQSIGSPKYSNSIYASLITAGCRTQILDAIATHPTKAQSLVMVATDGVYFREPHPNLDIDKNRLGAWDMKEKENLTLMMPGVYWDDKLRKGLAENKSVRFKSRGISASDLAREIGNLDEQWKHFHDTVAELDDRDTVSEDIWPTLQLRVSFAMTSAKQAVVRGAWDTAGDITTGAMRNVTSHPDLKRCVTQGWHLENDNGLIRSFPWRTNPVNPSITETTYYEQRFGEEMREEKEDDPINDDAPTVYDPFGWIWKKQDD